jgi:hypothetical protein
VKAIASGNEIAPQLSLLIVVDEMQGGLRCLNVRHLAILDIEQQGFALAEAGGNQILEDFMLRVDRDRSPVGQLG